MNGVLALLGSGEFTGKIIEVDRYLLSKIKDPKVGIIPIAAKKEADYKKWIKRGIKHFKSLGVTVGGLDGDSDLVDEFNIYYFSGGDPGYLLNNLKNSLFWKKILENYKNGSMIVGSSAGGMVMGKKVWSKVYDFVEKGIRNPWEDGLGVVNFGLIPHYDLVNNDFSKEQIKIMKKMFPKDIPIKGIDENTALIKLGNKWVTKGAGGVHLLS